MAEKPSYEDLEQKVQELQNEVLGLRQVKQALGGSAENIHSFLDELRDGFFVSDSKGAITYLNKALGDIFGYDNPQEAVGKHFSEHLSPDVLEGITEKFNRAISDKNYSELIELPALRKDGSTVFVQLKHSPVMEGGNIVGTKGMLRDITARKNREKVLRERTRWKRALLDGITESVFLIDLEGKIQTINKTAAERFGGTVETFTGLNVNDLMPPHLAEARQAKHAEVIRTGLPLRFIPNHRTKTSLKCSPRE
jgi:PAS domain S-box-containing protein